MTDARQTAKTGKTDGAAARGVALWLTIAVVVAIGLVLAARHGDKVTSLLGTTT